MDDRQAVIEAAGRIGSIAAAHRIAHEAGIPLERAYEVLVSLEARGWAQVVASDEETPGKRPAGRAWRVM
jgi:hypothetical protein